MRRQVGVVEQVELGADKVLRALVRFSKSSVASEILDDVRDGIRGNTSVGYDIDDYAALPKGDGYRITKWSPMEVSIVSIPADPSVGVGRSADMPTTTVEVVRMKRDEITAPDNQGECAAALARREAEIAASEEAVAARGEAIADVYDLAARHNIPRAEVSTWLTTERRALPADRLLAQFRGFVLGKLEGRPLVDMTTGLSAQETRRFSLFKLLRAMTDPDTSTTRAAAFELEACDAAQQVAAKHGIVGRGGHRLPDEILLNWSLASSPLVNGKRVLNTSDDAAIVPTEYLAGSFIDLLRKNTSVMRAGATILSGLHGSLEIPKQTASGSAAWITAEDGSATATEPTFGQVTMAPHDLAAYVDMTRRMMQQSSPAIENLVRNDILNFMRLEVDRAGLEGSGSAGQPKGVLSQVGINKPTNFAAVTPTWAEVVAMETAVADDEALEGALAYIGRTNMRGSLKTTPKVAGHPVFIMDGAGNELNGYPYVASNQGTDGNLYFGNWANLLIGFWSGLEIAVDTAGALALKGAKRIIAFQTMDVAVRYAESFCWNCKAP